MPTYQLKKGTVCRHHSGRVYTVLALANASAPSPKFPVTVVYMGANGETWARSLTEFVDRFTVLYDGTNTSGEGGRPI